MKLSELIDGLDIVEIDGETEFEITGVYRDHRACMPGSLFVCIEGFKTDGHLYIDSALENGVVALIVQKEVKAPTGVTVVRTKNTRYALAFVSDVFFGHPSRKLTIAGITGTKGKTTITYMIRSIAKAAGINSGLIGTVENLIGDEKIHSVVTTPESYDLQRMLSHMVEKEVGLVAMEVSSQGLALNRVSCCDFNIGVFTNLFNDHISPNEHKDIEDYFSAKLKLFDMCETGLINADFKDADRVMKHAEQMNCKVYTYGIDSNADIMARNIAHNVSGDEMSVSFDLVSPWLSGRMELGLPGKFNLSNALAAIGVCLLVGVSHEAICEGIKAVKVRGRVEIVKAGQDFSVIVDYAHNAASLENLLKMLREFCAERIITVFGCGGDRAKDRRFEMGEVSGRLSDLTVITSDNPRTEDPVLIIENIEEGVRKTSGEYIKVADRRKGIEFALCQAKKGDLVVIAGKGHETTQVFSDRTEHFDDVEIANDILRGKMA
ncbi:MAG: UDP-N-acetylmuramoyl-L-alanyl-D-glutamate--2,6-diaminopimelate ligase [Synergistaceae bacterium]|nr:UDP-N-acetylmuramoyl-L-alanyl-D-glutamate--2,6-diaminopimelate ligase [Synergistaceae bacterium]